MHQENSHNATELFSAFQLFKYAVYLILAYNIYAFYQEEAAAAVLMNPHGVDWGGFINAYAATIDTAAWVLLLLLFELETWTIPDEYLTRPIKLTFTIIRSFCYAFIASAFVGYFQTFLELQGWQSITGNHPDLCHRVGQSFMYSLERFTEINLSNCSSLAQSQQLLTLGEGLVTDAQHFSVSWWLSVADVVNSADWILVVLILEVEVWLLTRGPLGKLGFTTIKYVKACLYAVLVTIAIFWGFYGEFIDFWDAFMWIVAFVFIENNVVQWQEEVAAEETISSNAAKS